MGVVNFNALLFDPIHTIFGEEATLTPETSSGPLTLSAIDKTAGVPVGDPHGVETIVPAAVIRMAELLAGGLSAADLSGAALELNDKTWRVESYRLLPTPKGEADGEAMLFLIED